MNDDLKRVIREEQTLVVDPEKDIEVLKGLASKVRIQIIKLLHDGEKNINEIADTLSLPQSTVAANIIILEKAGLIKTRLKKGLKGNQKICTPVYQEILITFLKSERDQEDNVIEVAMPVGLYTEYNVSPPCGLCSYEGIIGYLDSPHSFLDPGRAKASLIWFEQGYVEYKFPNNGYNKTAVLDHIEILMELSSEKPGTDLNWPSDISLWVNDIEIGHWTSPGDFGDRRGKFTPSFWKLEGSQYGLLKTWRITKDASFIDGVKISSVSLNDVKIEEHHSVRIRVGVKENAEHVGGVNIFGKGFGNYDQHILLRLCY